MKKNLITFFVCLSIFYRVFTPLSYYYSGGRAFSMLVPVFLLYLLGGLYKSSHYNITIVVALFPVFLIMCFIKSWVGVLSKIGCLILGLFYLLMLGIIVMYISMKMWDAVIMGVAFSFAAFLVTFGAVAVGVAIEDITDKLSNILAS